MDGIIHTCTTQSHTYSLIPYHIKYTPHQYRYHTQVTPVFLKQYATGLPPYRIDGVWSTATALTIPNASAPGRAESDVVQQMSPDLIVFLLRNVTKVCAGVSGCLM